MDYDDIGEASETKVRKTTNRRSPRSEEKLPKANIFDNPPLPLTRLFNDKEICVINGNDDLPKERIEKILLQHRAKVVQNPLKENYCIIVGNVKTVIILITFSISYLQHSTNQYLKFNFSGESKQHYTK